MPLTTHRIIKESVDKKTGDIVRVSKETTTIIERISKDGRTKYREVGVDLYPDGKQAKDEAAKKRKEMIERITKMVQDLEIHYYTGNALVECLKNRKINIRTKNVKPKYYIPNRDSIIRLYDTKHGTQFTNDDPLEVIDKTIALYEELMRRVDEFKLEERWRRKIVEGSEFKLAVLKKKRSLKRTNNE